MKKKLIGLLMSLAMIVSSFAGMVGLFPQTTLAADVTFPVTIAVGEDNSGRMPTGLSLTDAKYDIYFGGNSGDAAKKVPEILAAGKLSVNGMTFPKDSDEFAEKGFSVNEKAVNVTETGESYAAAAVKAVTGAVPIGNPIQLIDDNEDGVADTIIYVCFAASIINKITSNGDGTVTIERADIQDGKKPYDGNLFEAGKGLTVVPASSTELKAGDMVLVFKFDENWHAVKAAEAHGILVDGQDHGSYNIAGTNYPDAMRFSRDNIVISNRCGEFTNAMKYFGLNNKEGYEVSLWLVPIGEDSYGAPAGFTSGENGKKILAEALKQANEKLNSVKISKDGKDCKLGDKWVTQENYDAMKAVIDNAQKVYDDAAVVGSEYYDHQLYILYLALHGSADDIGASFAGYNYEGFDNQIQSKPETIVINMGEDKKADDTKYDKLYKEGSAKAGISALIAKGKVFINGFAIPATEAEFKENGYTVNEHEWLVAEDGGTYKVDRTGGMNYADAAAAVLGRVSNGNEIRLYDDDQDGFIDRIEADYVEAMIADKIESETTKSMRGESTTYTVTRAEVDESLVFEGKDGRVYDGETKALSTQDANFDTSIKEGDMILFKKTPSGWVIERAKEVNGILTDGADHEFYQIDSTKYGDAMRFSRDNIIISNRCGELVNAHKYFGFIDNKDGLKVSLWFVNTTDESKWGAPAGFTTGGNAATFLDKAIKIAEGKLDGVVASKDGKDVDPGKKWATQENIDALKAAIDRAKKVLAAKPSDALMDYQVYLLYFALNGSAQDIGAKFAGFNYEGFDNQVKDGLKDDSLFPDVADPSQPYYKPVYWAAKNGIIKGFSDGTFGPEKSCTREQFVIMIWRYAGRPAASAKTNFSDITSSRSSYKAIQWAVEKDIIRGFDDGTFKPEGTVTRRQVAVMLWRMNGRKSAAKNADFSDVAASESTYKAIQWGAEAGMIKGYSDGTFKPENDCLRMHIAIMLYRYARDVDGVDVSK